MKMLFCVYDRTELLPFFLNYYSRIGITEFICGVHNGPNNPAYSQVANFAYRFPLTVIESFSGAVTRCDIGNAEIEFWNRLKLHFQPNEWHAIADLDEFVFFPEGESCVDVARQAEILGVCAVGGSFCDRVSLTGCFPSIGNTLDQTYPLACDLTRFLGGKTSKVVLVKGNVNLGAGHHMCNTKTFKLAEVHHFKWINGVMERIQARYQLYVQTEVSYAKKLINLQKLVGDAKRIPLELPELNVRQARRIGI
jgi:hypothetical protein